MQPIFVEATMCQIFLWMHAMSIASWVAGPPSSHGAGTLIVVTWQCNGKLLLPWMVYR